MALEAPCACGGPGRNPCFWDPLAQGVLAKLGAPAGCVPRVVGVVGTSREVWEGGLGGSVLSPPVLTPLSPQVIRGLCHTMACVGRPP